MTTLIKLAKAMCPKDSQFIETLRLKSKGKLFFKNGVYDFAIGKLREETDDDMTPIRIMKNYKEESDTEAKKKIIDVINSIFEKKWENQKGLSDNSRNMIQHLARGLAGCIEDKDFVIGTGLRDCGKGVLTLLANAFAPYVSCVDANNFLGKKRIGTSDESLNRKWLLPHMWSRLLFGNELDIDNDKEKSVINGVLIKSLCSGGDVQRARGLYKSEIEFIFNGRLIFFMNEVPEISPPDACQRLTFFEFPNKFINPIEYEEKKTNKDLAIYERKGDPNIKDLLQTDKYLSAFINIVLSEYVNHPVENTKAIQQSCKEFRIEMGDDLLFYKERFDFTDINSFTSFKILDGIINENKSAQTKQSPQKIKSFLCTNMACKHGHKKVDGIDEKGYFGIKLK
jgi:phage/plasmid-associated DNA primase